MTPCSVKWTPAACSIFVLTLLWFKALSMHLAPLNISNGLFYTRSFYTTAGASVGCSLAGEILRLSV